jgi:hypothetical protein
MLTPMQALAMEQGPQATQLICHEQDGADTHNLNQIAMCKDLTRAKYKNMA